MQSPSFEISDLASPRLNYVDSERLRAQPALLPRADFEVVFVMWAALVEPLQWPKSASCMSSRKLAIGVLGYWRLIGGNESGTRVCVPSITSSLTPELLPMVSVS